MATPHLTIRPGNPDFLDLDWERTIAEWDSERLVELPTGVHRHEIRFVSYPRGIYAIKELPLRYARNEYSVLRELEGRAAPAVEPVGIAERPWVDPHDEMSAAVITRYLDFAFSYRELVSGGGFGPRRKQLLDGFAWLMVQLHLSGCYWGDCSLSNVLYRYDADAIEVTMVDAETADLHDHLSEGQRREDLEIMEVNVAGGMADVAAEQGLDIDDADLFLGEDIAARYHALWEELTSDVIITKNELYRIEERIARLNQLGFQVDDMDLEPVSNGSVMRVSTRIGGRSFHADRLREMTGLEASENQAHQLLSDLFYFEAQQGNGVTASRKTLAAIKWRIGVFEPLLARITSEIGEERDPIQAYCDFLVHRYIMSEGVGQDVGNEAALEDWLERGQPGYPLPA